MRHLKILKEEWGMMECKAVNTPVEPGSEVGVGDEEGVLMDPESARKYRRSAAMLTYLALDRLDLSVCANLGALNGETEGG